MCVKLDKTLTRDDLQGGGEYALYIINALMGGEPFKFNGNVPNTNLVTNLPQAPVSKFVHVDKGGFRPSMSVHYRQSVP